MKFELLYVFNQLGRKCKELAERQTDGQTNRQTNRKTDGWTDRGMDRQTEGWTDRQRDGQTDRGMDRQTDGQMYIVLSSNRPVLLPVSCPCKTLGEHHASPQSAESNFSEYIYITQQE